ncbi:uncharacterized protein [Temnothorax nylanderi]|uniref:uncharacterized protein n=1 Tax=Temnothorax nylanderi TaxID=102681 RepID=UPI003A8B7939
MLKQASNLGSLRIWLISILRTYWKRNPTKKSTHYPTTTTTPVTPTTTAEKLSTERCLHYFSSSEKLAVYGVDCQKLNNCAIQLPIEDDKWLQFQNYGRKERVPFIVYADLECTLKKMEADPGTSTYTYQHHEVFSVGYYVRCSYDDSLSTYRRNKDCIVWFAGELEKLAHSVKSILSDNVHMIDLTPDEWEIFHSAKHCYICEKPFAPDDTRFLHNLPGYDSHFIIKKIATVFEGSINVLPITKEKDKLKIVRSQFSQLSIEDFDLLTRKGVFPYEYVDCIDKLQDPCLPPHESFYSLTDDTVSESDYEHAANVWRRFSIQTLGEYSDLYLKTDVLLLADIFENFRDSSIKSYGLDPAHYYTLPGFTWDAMLKHTRINFELLTDIDMVTFIERGIRSGLSQCSDRYAQANNIMCQPLPYMNFRWIDDISDFDVSAIASDSPTGYILEVDLEYPQCLHDAHSDLPFCPTSDKP